MLHHGGYVGWQWLGLCLLTMPLGTFCFGLLQHKIVPLLIMQLADVAELDQLMIMK